MPSNRFTNKWALGMSLLSPLHSALVQALASAPQQRWMRMIAQKKRWYIMILYVYIIKYIYKHQNTTSYIIILRYWQYSRENPSCFHLTSLNSITGATNSLFHTCLHYTIRSQTISNHLKPWKKNVRKWKDWKKNISTTSCPTIPHAQRLGAQLQPQQVDPQILLPEKVPASKTCKWNAQNIETN